MEGMEVDLMGRRGHRFFLGGGGGGLVVRCWGFIEEKSPDFRFPEVGISVDIIFTFLFVLFQWSHFT